MSNGDDSSGGNRTVFRPSPLAGLGGGQPRPAPVPPPEPAPPPAATPQAESTAQQAAPVSPAATPAVPTAVEPQETPPPSAPNTPPVSAAPPAAVAPSPVAPPAAPPPSPRAPLAAAAAAAAPGQRRLSDDGIPPPPTPADIRAPLVSAAAPLLGLVASVRSGRARIGMAEFHREAGHALEGYDRAIGTGYPEEVRRAARYLVAATVDDIAGNLPNLDGSAGWEGRSLVAEHVGTEYGEDELWREVDVAIEKPDDRYDLIELAHACLAAGFQGRCRGQPNGGEELEKRSEKLFKALDHTRGLSQRFVSPQWVGFNAPLQKVPTVSFIALAAAAALVLILLAYIALRVATQEDAAAPSVASEQESAA